MPPAPFPGLLVLSEVLELLAPGCILTSVLAQGLSFHVWAAQGILLSACTCLCASALPLRTRVTSDEGPPYSNVT